MPVLRALVTRGLGSLALVTRGFSAGAGIIDLDIREGLVAFLLADSIITGFAGIRIRPGVLNEGDILPAITYQMQSNERGLALGGPNGTSVAIIQIDYWSRSKKDTVKLKRRVDSLLHGFQGDMGGIEVMYAVQDFENDRSQFPDDASDMPYFNLASQFKIGHRV